MVVARLARYLESHTRSHCLIRADVSNCQTTWHKATLPDKRARQHKMGCLKLSDNLAQGNTGWDVSNCQTRGQGNTGWDVSKLSDKRARQHRMWCLKLSDTETSWHKATQDEMSQTVRQASTRQHRMRCLKLSDNRAWQHRLRCLKLSDKLAQGNTGWDGDDKLIFSSFSNTWKMWNDLNIYSCVVILCYVCLHWCAVQYCITKNIALQCSPLCSLIKNHIAHYCVRTVKSLKDQKHDAIGCLECDTSFNRFY